MFEETLNSNGWNFLYQLINTAEAYLQIELMLFVYENFYCAIFT